MKKPFKFTYENIGEPIECSVHALKPFLKKYFDDKGVDESTGKREKQIHIIAFAHAIERGLLDYLDELEEFNS